MTTFCEEKNSTYTPMPKMAYSTNLNNSKKKDWEVIVHELSRMHLNILNPIEVD